MDRGLPARGRRGAGGGRRAGVHARGRSRARPFTRAAEGGPQRTHEAATGSFRSSARAATVRGKMAARRDKVAVELDARIIERTRAELGARAESDAAVVERALNAYLLGRV